MADDDGEIPYDDLAHFIVQVRQMVSKDYRTKRDYERVFQRLRNLSTRLYRDHVGYTPGGTFRLKRRDERTFKDAVDAAGGRDKAIGKWAGRNPALGRILRGQDGEPVPPASDPPPPLHLVRPAPETPEWAEEFDPESREPVGHEAAAGVALVDLDTLEVDPEAAALEFEAVDLDEED